MKKMKKVVVPITISLLIMAMSMLLSGCSLLNDEIYFGIPTGYYDLVEGNVDNGKEDYKLYVDKH